MSATRRRAEQVLADKYGPTVGEWGAALLDDAGLLATAPREQGTAEAATEGGEPWLAMPVERAIERLERSTAADTISEHRHAVITLQNFARHALAATPRAGGEAGAAADLLAPAHDIACVINDHFNRRGADPNGMDGDDAIALLDAAQATIRDHCCAPPALEVVGGAEAASLPDGSRVVSSGFYDELPEPGARVHQIGAGRELPPIHAPRQWVVLHRAAAVEPPVPLAVGDVVETAADLDRLPMGAVVRDADSYVSERHGADWFGTCQDGPIGVVLPARVLDLPGGTS